MIDWLARTVNIGVARPPFNLIAYLWVLFTEVFPVIGIVQVVRIVRIIVVVVPIAGLVIAFRRRCNDRHRARIAYHSS